MKGLGGDLPQDELGTLKITVILSCCLMLPVVFPVPFSLFTGFLAVPIFYLFRTFPLPQGKLIVRNASFIFGVLGLLAVRDLSIVLFPLTFIPLGYSFYVSAERNDPPWIGVGKGIIVLGTTWLVFWLCYAAGYDINPYTELKHNLDNWLSELYETYKSDEIPADVLLNFKHEIERLRELVPRILPGILVSSIVVTVWMNQLITNIALRKTKPERAPWPEYRKWFLPDVFVWALIFAGVLFLISSGFLRNLGLCLLFISSVVYFLQGLAVLLHYFDKWNTPKPLRIVIVFIISIQTTAFLVLAAVGLIDIWRDFRQLRQKDPQSV